MKILISLILLYSVNTFASNCPDISGQFVCQSGSRIILKTIEQTELGYFINSDGTTFEYITDGVSYDVPANENMKDASIKSYCRNNKFVSDFKATVLYDGSKLAKQFTSSEYQLKGEELTVIQKTKMMGLPMPTISLLCKRN
jgi:hypothetical protein